MGCTDPLRREIGAPYQCLSEGDRRTPSKCPLGVSSKLPLLLDADVHTVRSNDSTTFL